jgi:putative ABC transport system permease protein
MLDSLVQDLRYALRQLARNPGFTAVAGLTLALGIGANTAIFSAVKTVLLMPLPFRDQASLVWIWERDLRTDDPRNPVSPLSFAAFRDETQVFEGIGSSRDAMYTLTGEGEPETLIAYRFSHDFFQVLGMPPLLGRTFLPEEDRPGAAPVVVLSHALWTRRFAADPGIVGRSITLDGQGYTVVGVMPKGFAHPRLTELWTPLALTPELAAAPDRRFLRLVARLKPGTSIAQAQAAVGGVAARLSARYPDSHGNWGAVVNPIESRYTGDVKPALLVLLGAVGFVLLIACANVANLLLARGAGRMREIAVRAALGASRGRVVRQLLSESLALALFGGALGTLFAQWGLSALLGLFPRSIFNVAIPRLDEIRLDAGVLAFTLLVSLATGLLFGLLPALQVSRVRLGEALQHATRGAGGVPPGQRLRSALVVAEVALAVVLVAGGALMLKGFLRLQGSSLGFDPKGLMTARVLLPEYRYGDPTKRLAFLEQSVARISALTGVEAVGVTPFLPLSGWSSGRTFRIEGQTPPAPGQEPEAELRVVNEDYFRAMRIPLVRGRAFAESDREGATRVALVNETMARRFFAGEDPLGRRVFLQFRGDDPPEDPRHWREIVGVVADVRHYGLTQPAVPEIYLAWRQDPVELIGFAVRTAADPMSLVKGVRDAVWAVDKDQPVTMAMSYEQLASDSITLQRASARLVSFFAGVALLLAALGIYGVMAYAVARRTHEIGVRMAMGARERDVIGLVLGQGLRLAGIGVVLGLAASLALTRVLGSLLHGVSTSDPASFAGVLVLVAAAALLACYLPARRATRVDPMVALRCE